MDTTRIKGPQIMSLAGAKLGPDARTRPDTAAVGGTATSSQIDALTEIDELTTRPVVTEEGALLGQVAAFQVDPWTLQQARVAVSADLLTSNQSFPADQVTPIGGDALMGTDAVAAPAAAAMTPADDPVELAVP